MKLLVVGLGSMGKRRVRNLTHIGAGVIAGFDPREDRRSEAESKYGIRTWSDFDQAFQEHRPDAMIISTPPDLHVRYAKIALERGCHFFSEASVVDDGMDQLIALHQSRRHLTAAPSCTLRFHPGIGAIKRVVETESFGQPLLVTYHSGQWLPDWHPWEDYRSFYVSKRLTGACREIVPFELSWLTWLLGDVKLIAGMKGKLSTLDCDIDDAYQVLMQFKSGALGHLLVDVIARTPVRNFRLCSERATIEWDAIERRVRVFDIDRKEWTVIPEPERIQEPGYVSAENMYIDEMKEFVASCKGEKSWPYTLEDDKRNLELLLAIEQSSEGGRHIAV